MKNKDFLQPTAQHSSEHSFSDALLHLFQTETIHIKEEVD